jgi:site-specific recombinase XerD
MPQVQLSQTSNLVELERLIEIANRFIHSAKAPTTVKAYRSDWRDFEAWCLQRRLMPLPSKPETVALYIADRAATLKSGTITRRLTSITMAHRTAGFADTPASTRHLVVAETLKGIRRTIGTAQKGKDPLLTADIRKIVIACPNNLFGLRDRALALVGFAGEFRRSELARIEVRELTFRQVGRDRERDHFKDRPRRRRPQGGTPVRSAPNYVSGSRPAGVALRRSRLPSCEPASASI